MILITQYYNRFSRQEKEPRLTVKEFLVTAALRGAYKKTVKPNKYRKNGPKRVFFDRY